MYPMTTTNEIKPARIRKMAFPPYGKGHWNPATVTSDDEQWAIVEKFVEVMGQRSVNITELSKKFNVTRAMIYELVSCANDAIAIGSVDSYKVKRFEMIIDAAKGV